MQSEVDHQLLRLAGIELKMIELTPVDKVSDDLPVLLIVPARYTPDNGCIMCERLEVTAHRVVVEVRRVQAEEEGGESSVPCAADHHVRHSHEASHES